MTASKVFTAVVARSMSGADSTLTTPQLRLLVVLEARGPMNLSALSAELRIDPSTTSRTCERLVRSGLVSRVEDPDDRRRVTLRLSRRGDASVERLMKRRREVLAGIVEQMRTQDRQRLAGGLAAFVRVAEGILDPSVVADRGLSPPQG